MQDCILQTCLLQNLYVNPQNSAKSADGSHRKYIALSFNKNIIYIRYKHIKFSN